VTDETPHPQAPQNYLIHTVVIAIILAVSLVLFLRHAWG
jgi:hypothetical protein